VALERIDFNAHDIGAGRPLSLDFNAALAATGQNLSGFLRLDRLPSDADPATAPPPVVNGRLTLKGASLDRLSALLPAQLDALAQGGLASVDATLSTAQDGAYVLQGKAQLEAVRLRGEPARGSAVLVATVPAAHPDALTVQLREIVLQGPGVDLAGSAQLALSPPSGRFDLQGPTLDLDRLLALRPKEEKPQAADGDGLVPPAAREQLAGVSMAGKLAVGELRSGALVAKDVHADVTLSRGVLNVRQGQARLYGGGVKLDGTKVNLLAERPVWELQATLEGVDLGQAVAEVAQQRPISGRVNAQLSLKGDGNDWSELRQRLTGHGSMTVQQGALSADLGERIGTPLREVLARAGKTAAAGKVEAAQGTRLENLAASFTVQDGWLRLSRPLALQTPVGAAALSGRVGLDWKLDLNGDIALAPQFVGRVSGGRFTPEGPVQVPLGLGGTLGDPQVRLQVTPDLVVKGLAQSAPAKQLQQRIQREVQGRFKGLIERIPH
jgi:AsmA protein